MVRALAVLVTVGVVLSLWMHDLLSAGLISKLKSWHSHPSFGSPQALNMSLSDVFFPVPDLPGESNTLAVENSKMLHALINCMEQKTCYQNQTKGSSISTCISIHEHHISFQ